MPCGIVLSLVQFDFSYSSAIVTLNSAFILGSSASKFNAIKAIFDLELRCYLQKSAPSKTHFFCLSLLQEVTSTSKAI